MNGRPIGSRQFPETHRTGKAAQAPALAEAVVKSSAPGNRPAGVPTDAVAQGLVRVAAALAQQTAELRRQAADASEQAHTLVLLASRLEQQKEQAPAWLHALHHTLLLHRCRLDATVRLAVQQYREAAADLKKIGEVTGRLPGHERADLLTRGRRQLAHYARALQELRVEILAVRPGDVFAPHLHEAVQFVPGGKDATQGTIAWGESPAFRWRDESGQDQIIPAPVVVIRQEIAPAGGPRTSEPGLPVGSQPASPPIADRVENLQHRPGATGCRAPANQDRAFQDR